MGCARLFPIASQKSGLRALLSPHDNAIGMCEIQGIGPADARTLFRASRQGMCASHRFRHPV